MPVRVLVVIEKDFRFSDTDPMVDPGAEPDFTFNTLVSALTDAGMQVTKAHRVTGGETDTTADISDFHFSTTNLFDFDAIWLIGREGRNSQNSSGSSVALLSSGEMTPLAQFMEAGGGVFASGDHDSIGAPMCANIPRVRVMRSWFGQNDGTRPAALASIADNFKVLGTGRADTTEPSPMSVYSGHPAPFLWFENQSDRVPQPIVPVPPTHPILRHNGGDITVFPDHMHEGNTLDGTSGFDFINTKSPFGDTAMDEFRLVAGQRELPRIIANGTIPGGNAIYTAADSSVIDATHSAPMKPVNTLSIYDGRNAGVGRIVTGSTFHHYIDINLTGAKAVTGSVATQVGNDAQDGQGFNADMTVLEKIKAVYVNITNWLARPRRAIGLILERSTFSQDEAPSGSQFDSVILLTVDGLKPTQFPAGGIPALGPIAGNPGWVPQITVMGAPIAIDPLRVDSDDPAMPMPDRLQRFTFTYRVRFTADAFMFGGTFNNVPVNATLSPIASGVLNDSATIQLVKSANPFMLDLADGNNTTWLSSDVKIFHVVEGESFHGIDTLPAGATRAHALTFINNVANMISSATFTALPSGEEASSLSPVPKTTGTGKNVYNFALARVRLSSAGADANGVRVFFRVFGAPTTAALTYHLDGGMPPMPIDAYLKTAGANPISLPGSQSGQWVSFPMFAADRVLPPESQPIGPNVKNVQAAVGFKVFGALVDNNLTDLLYLTQTPGGGPIKSLPDLLMGEHQCIVAQVEYASTPIPDGATPWTSDKLSQRNIALHSVANPGLEASRVAVHTFEIEATPIPISPTMPPDELLLNWPTPPPDGTVLRLHIPSWNARDVVDLADRLYPRHEIEAIDDHTIEIPAGGTRYIPIPMSYQRQTGVLEVEFPLGIRKGQRFDVSIRQITNRFRQAQIPPPRVQSITLEEAAKIIDTLPVPKDAATPARGAYDLGDNKVLYTDLSYFDAVSDHALIIQHPDPAVVKAAVADAARWRVPIGAFQLGVPVSTKTEMLPYHARLLSVMRWRAAHLPRQSRWYKTMQRYLDILSAKVQALGGDPWAIPATPDGAIPLPGQGGEGVVPSDDPITLLKKLLSQPLGCGLALAIALLIIILLVLLLR
jgi:hypothetical protein